MRVEIVFFFSDIFFKNRGGHVGGSLKTEQCREGEGVATGNREGKLYMQK